MSRKRQVEERQIRERQSRERQRREIQNRENQRKDLIRDKRRRRKRRKCVLTVLFLLILFLSVGALVVWKVFTVKEVKVEGNEHYSNEQIQKFVLSDEYSWNSLYVALKYKFMKQEEIPFVDTMEISLENPHTLQIHVYEKGILGYLYISSIDQNAYFDKDGFIVETSRKKIEGIPQIEGLNCDKVVLYEKIPLKNEKILRGLLTATQALKKNDVVPQKIEFAKNGEITLNYGSVDAVMGNSDYLTQKILRLAYILPQLEGKSGILHLENWTENTTDIVFEQSK